MVNRKEVKIDEEQIRSMMTGDIPAAVMEKIYGDNAAGSKKEEDKGLDTENNPGFLPYPTRWKIPAHQPEKKHPLRSFGRKPAEKGTACRNTPGICLTTTL